MGNQLENGSVLPAMAGKDAEGNDVDIAQLLAGGWGVALFYRGHW